MTERLKQIWTGFEETTTRRLTGKGVDDILVPRRVDYADIDHELLPEGFEDPSKRAFEALHQELASAKKKFSLKGKQRKPAAKVETSQSMAPQAADGEELLKGMRATAMRTERTDMDYESFLSSDAGKAVRKKTRKKRFGIF